MSHDIMDEVLQALAIDMNLRWQDCTDTAMREQFWKDWAVKQTPRKLGLIFAAQAGVARWWRYTYCKP